MTKPIRLQLSRRKGFDLQSLSHKFNGRDAVVVSRPGRWGNPFTVTRKFKPGTKVGGSYVAVESAEEAVLTYREYLKLHPDLVTEARIELRNKPRLLVQAGDALPRRRALGDCEHACGKSFRRNDDRTCGPRQRSALVKWNKPMTQPYRQQQVLKALLSYPEGVTAKVLGPALGMSAAGVSQCLGQLYFQLERKVEREALPRNKNNTIEYLYRLKVEAPSVAPAPQLTEPRIAARETERV